MGWPLGRVVLAHRRCKLSVHTVTSLIIVIFHVYRSSVRMPMRAYSLRIPLQHFPTFSNSFRTNFSYPLPPSTLLIFGTYDNKSKQNVIRRNSESTSLIASLSRVEHLQAQIFDLGYITLLLCTLSLTLVSQSYKRIYYRVTNIFSRACIRSMFLMCTPSSMFKFYALPKQKKR